MDNQEKLLAEALQNVRQHAFAMKRVLDQQSVMEGLKHAANMLGELRTSLLSPKNYYELRKLARRALLPLTIFVACRRCGGCRRTAPPGTVLGWRVRTRARQPRSLRSRTIRWQYRPKIVREWPLELSLFVDWLICRYLLITIGHVYIRANELPRREVLRDLVEMCRGVQHPLRGLFLRNYLLQCAKSLLPDTEEENQWVEQRTNEGQSSRFSPERIIERAPFLIRWTSSCWTSRRWTNCGFECNTKDIRGEQRCVSPRHPHPSLSLQWFATSWTGTSRTSNSCWNEFSPSEWTGMRQRRTIQDSKFDARVKPTDRDWCRLFFQK